LSAEGIKLLTKTKSITMGTEAEYLIDREMFGDDDFYPSLTPKQIKDELKRRLTPAEKKIASIRKEIAIMVNEQGIGIGEARKQMNLKYGKGWRERGLVSNSDNQWSEEELAPYIS
jgi:hypothetical protein